MARADAGSVTVATSGTAVQITSSIATNSRVRAKDKIRSIEISPRSNNSGTAMYFGRSNVTTSYGHRILKGDSHSIDFPDGGDDFSEYYMDADSNGDVADWVVTW